MAQVCLNCNRESPDGRFSCQHCGASFVTGSTPSTPKSSGSKLINLVLVGALVWIFGYVLVDGFGNMTSEPLNEATQSRIAYDRCKEAVGNQLVAPDTAEFSSYEGVVVEREENIHRFTGEVDSKNRLGVSLRLTFICAVEENSGGAFRVNDALVLEP